MNWYKIVRLYKTLRAFYLGSWTITIIDTPYHQWLLPLKWASTGKSFLVLLLVCSFSYVLLMTDGLIQSENKKKNSGCTGWSLSSPMASTKWSTSLGWTQVNTELHLITTRTLPSDHVHTSSNCTSETPILILKFPDICFPLSNAWLFFVLSIYQSFYLFDYRSLESLRLPRRGRSIFSPSFPFSIALICLALLFFFLFSFSCGRFQRLLTTRTTLTWSIRGVALK
jgi:hypothetical protein